MQFAIYYLDRPDQGAIRQQHRDAHIAYRKGLGQKLLLAGPLLSEDSRPVGSLVLIEAESLPEATKIANADPYVSAGLFETVSVHAYRVMASNLAAPR